MTLDPATLWGSMALAVGLDLALGDPPNRWHPVAWVGSSLLTARRVLPKAGRLVPWLAGLGVMVVGISTALAVGWGIERGLKTLPNPLAIITEAVALKLTFSIRGLARAARQVADALRRVDLPEARRLASWHLVGRATADLDAPRVAAAAIESVAENASDGVVAPLLCFAVGGLPLAFAYRVANTADSVLGHRDRSLEWLGKVPARLDDLLNLAPSRLTALGFVLAAPGVGGRWTQAARIWRRDRGTTASPNAGHPMAAAAGALGVELEKVDHYRLGAGLREPDAGDIDRAVRLLFVMLAVLAGPLALIRLGTAYGRIAAWGP